MTDTDMLYVAALEKENAALKQRIAELEERHYNECTQIAHYSDELRETKELIRYTMSQLTPVITELAKDLKRNLNKLQGFIFPKLFGGAEND